MTTTIDAAACHAQERAMERYGLALSFDDLRALEQLVGTKGLIVRREVHGTELRCLLHAGMAILVVWNPTTARVLTFLPRENACRGAWVANRIRKARKAGHKPRRRRFKG